MLATEWDSNTMQPNGWIMTEKYDGVRLYWNGNNFITRHGRKIQVPSPMSIQMPSIALDGELW